MLCCGELFNPRGYPRHLWAAAINLLSGFLPLLLLLLLLREKKSKKVLTIFLDLRNFFFFSPNSDTKFFISWPIWFELYKTSTLNISPNYISKYCNSKSEILNPEKSLRFWVFLFSRQRQVSHLQIVQLLWVWWKWRHFLSLKNIFFCQCALFGYLYFSKFSN